MNLQDIEQSVLDEIASYRYDVPSGALGHALFTDNADRLLEELRAALVKPEWRNVETSSESRRCALVADDGTYELYYDPVDAEFTLAMGDPPATIGVGGDAVGCWLAR